MEMNKPKPSLSEKWTFFWNVVFDPWVLLLFIATSIFVIVSSNTKDKELTNILGLLISILSGLLGGVIANRWSQLTEMKVLVARGKSAVRGLKLILLNISNVQKRTAEYIKCLDKENKEYKLIVSNFEEVIEKCNILEEEIVSSIENWTDIIPEIENFKTQIGIVSAMKEREEQLQVEIQNVRNELNQTQEAEVRAKSELNKKLQEKETELQKTKSELRKKENELNNSLFGGLYTATGGTAPARPFMQYATVTPNKCESCGKIFFQEGLVYETLCEECRKNKLSSR